MIRRSSTADGRSIRTLHTNGQDGVGELWQKSGLHKERTQGKHETSATRHRTTDSGPCRSAVFTPRKSSFRAHPGVTGNGLKRCVNLTTGRRVQPSGQCLRTGASSRLREASSNVKTFCGSENTRPAVGRTASSRCCGVN